MFSTQSHEKYKVARKIDFGLKEIGLKKKASPLSKKSIEEEYNSEYANWKNKNNRYIDIVLLQEL